MYAVDGRDQVVELEDIPQSNIGAPNPIVLAGERDLFVAYFVENTPPDWDGSEVRAVGPSTIGEPAALIRFHSHYASMFGPPNDEAFAGHPLASRGLRPYGAYEVRGSSWIRALERMNSVHPSHHPEAFSDYRHFVLAFHDTTFECVATAYEFKLASGAVRDLVAREAARLE